MASTAAGVVLKKATGLPGLAVAKNPHYTLGVLYGKTLRALQKIPSDAAYRKYTEQIVHQRAALVKSETNIEELEKKIGCGQIEEVIVQAENELSLARKMVEWKAWEPLKTTPPQSQWKWPM
ncbi:NADH dehydrogenase [ubiquinone] 1 alpha subcomplex subunit 5 [Orchesella cincta]|uniref:NADH dehydrogenase [ubiquinone] 1 alpha subcomplex subunit 5 n=1 Tax=Orchesella cincta TaxID=48709 RepID=A0A1D2MW47_ORCCI|nr:NADH dehydrogenase [ubiquinone] 1 alpha subcomplex subunit 5 [Orchesella cincta]